MVEAERWITDGQILCFAANCWYQEEELVPVLSRCVADWEVSEVDEPWRKFSVQ